jgi:predicted membrane protein
MNRICSDGRNRSMAFGLLIITIGIGLFLRSLNVFPTEVEDVIFRWPMLLILAGIYHFLCPGHRFSGFILLSLGVLFTLPQIAGFPLSFHQFFWPAFLILLGIGIITKHRNGKFGHFHQFEEMKMDENFIVDTNVFGGSQKIITTKQLKGGKLTSIFGGSEINLTQTELGSERVIFDLLYVFGGSSFIIPADWTIHIEVTNVFGGFSQKQIRPAVENPAKQVFFRGVIIFGGGEIKRF